VKVIPQNTDYNTGNGCSYVFSCFICNITELISLIETRTWRVMCRWNCKNGYKSGRHQEVCETQTGVYDINLIISECLWARNEHLFTVKWWCILMAWALLRLCAFPFVWLDNKIGTVGYLNKDLRRNCSSIMQHLLLLWTFFFRQIPINTLSICIVVAVESSLASI